MSEIEEDALRATILTEMFLGLGAEATEDRIGYYLRLLGALPPSILAESCDAAVMSRDEGYPPSPGAIRRQASRIRGERVKAAREAAAEARREENRCLVLAERAAHSREGENVAERSSAG